jgi:hypothetical protein
MRATTHLCFGACLLLVAAACEHAARSAGERTEGASAAAKATPEPKPEVAAPTLPVPDAPPTGTVATTGEQPTDPNAMPRVSVEEAAEMSAAGKAVIVDVRDAQTFQTRHIAGAVGIPLGELPTRLSELPRDKRILAYCS